MFEMCCLICKSLPSPDLVMICDGDLEAALHAGQSSGGFFAL